eukprot:m.25311 g.25311  ORF g.25311 m.25311 type:complete len:124 (+) comp7694_c0_seq2:138-509(+)
MAAPRNDGAWYETSVETPSMALMRKKQEARWAETGKSQPPEAPRSLELGSTLTTPSMSSAVEEEAFKKLETSVSGEAKRIVAQPATQRNKGYLDGVDKTLKFNPKDVPPRKKKYQQMKPYFQY